MQDAGTSFVTLMDAEQESLTARLTENREPAAAREALERSVDRMTYRYLEGCEDARLAGAAQRIMASVKAVLPVLEAVNDARIWQRNAQQSAKRRLSGAPLIMLIAGAVLALAGALVGYLASGLMTRLVSLLIMLALVALGGGLIYFAGLKAGAPGKPAGSEADVHLEYLVNTDDLMHVLRTTMIVTDAQLDALREQTAIERLADANPKNTGPLSAPEAELMSNLLELAYAHREDEDAAQMVSDIRFYLHGKGVDLVDYAPEHDSWFERLPAAAGLTLRPAMVQEGRVLKKGLASAASPVCA